HARHFVGAAVHLHASDVRPFFPALPRLCLVRPCYRRYFSAAVLLLRQRADPFPDPFCWCSVRISRGILIKHPSPPLSPCVRAQIPSVLTPLSCSCPCSRLVRLQATRR